MWKGVVLTDTPSATFQGRIPVARYRSRYTRAKVPNDGNGVIKSNVCDAKGYTAAHDIDGAPSGATRVSSRPAERWNKILPQCSSGHYRYFNYQLNGEGVVSIPMSFRVDPFYSNSSLINTCGISIKHGTRSIAGQWIHSGDDRFLSLYSPRCIPKGTVNDGLFRRANNIFGIGEPNVPHGLIGNFYRYHTGSEPANSSYYHQSIYNTRRGFASSSGSGKDGNKNVGHSWRNSYTLGIFKLHAPSSGLLGLSVDVLKWAVVLPFRIGMWTVQLFTLTLRMIGNLMRLSARAAVVARVSGVSGIFKSILDGLKHTIHWCKTGFRLYFANVKVSYYILLKRLKGHPMRYNERKLLMKTLNDALKMLPFSFFIIVPFAEFLLPVAIRLFPQMLPSTFRTDNSKCDDYLQKKLLAKKELAQFFQELVQERTNQIMQEELDSSLKTKMAALKDFQERLRNKEDLDVNPFLSSNELLVFSKLFKKEFKLDQMNLETLKVMCKLLGISPFSMRSHVVLQLRHHLLKIQREDRLILWEGVDSLTTEELQEACRERAMKFYNVTREQLQQQLQQWLDLSSMPEISPILLLWSRCFTMTHEPMAIKAEEELKQGEEISDTATKTLGSTEEGDNNLAEPLKQPKVAEKFAEEVTTAQKASSRRIVQAVTAAAEVDAQKLLNKEERLEELSLKAKELKDIIEGNIPQQEDEELVDGAQPFYDKKPEEFVDMHGIEERLMQSSHGDHVILHTNEINKLGRLHKQEILVRCEELLSALDLQRQISDLQHTQLTDMYTFLLKVSEDFESGKEFNFKEEIEDLVAAAREQMEKVEKLTHQFDQHNLTYD